jgi:uracil-DNA glycosylase family 4
LCASTTCDIRSTPGGVCPSPITAINSLTPVRRLCRIVAMSKDPSSDALEIAREIENQLKFYREMGFEDIGGSPPGVELAPAANPAAIASASPAPAAAPKIEQAGLFGEAIVSSKPGSSTPRGPSLPVLEPPASSLEAIREDLGDCRRCKLHEHRRTIVFGEGNPQARLVFVGEGPGAEEDASGRPFVGRAGQLLDKIIAAIGLAREDVYIANIVKCRPPENRTPERDEVETCELFLFRQLAFIRPEVIVALGSPAFQCLLRTREPITRARGEWRDWNGIKLMPTFHPAFLLRSPDKKREVWEDMKKVRDYLKLR